MLYYIFEKWFSSLSEAVEGLEKASYAFLHSALPLVIRQEGWWNYPWAERNQRLKGDGTLRGLMREINQSDVPKDVTLILEENALEYVTYSGANRFLLREYGGGIISAQWWAEPRSATCAAESGAVASALENGWRLLGLFNPVTSAITAEDWEGDHYSLPGDDRFPKRDPIRKK